MLQWTKYGFDVSIIDHRRGLRAYTATKAARRLWVLTGAVLQQLLPHHLTFHHRRLQQIFSSAALNYFSLLDSSTIVKESQTQLDKIGGIH